MMVHTYIVRGTTPPFEFSFDGEDAKLLDSDHLQSLSVTFKQDNGTTVKKKYENGVFSQGLSIVEGTTIIVRLSQEETLSFSPLDKVGIQLKILTKTGEVKTSDMYYALVYDVLDEEVML